MATNTLPNGNARQSIWFSNLLVGSDMVVFRFVRYLGSRAVKTLPKHSVIETGNAEGQKLPSASFGSAAPNSRLRLKAKQGEEMKNPRTTNRPES